MTDEILIECHRAIATVVLNRSKSHNSITLGMYARLPKILANLNEDPSVKVVIVRGAGDKAFASGADISEFERERGNAMAARNYNQRIAEAEHALEALEKPTIAMVHGYCIGGGAGLALACDIRFADTKALFAITPGKLGLVYSLESTRRVVDLVGPARAKWILMSGLQIPAERALALGLFDELAAPQDLEPYTYEFAATVCTRAQYSVRASKEMVSRIVLGQAKEDEATSKLRDASFDTEDYAEGVRAFLGKRAPHFR